jgi:hypothetical protein
MDSSRTLTAVLLGVLAVQTGFSRSPQNTSSTKSEESFFAVAVWYGGGKVRAPMLEPIITGYAFEEELDPLPGSTILARFADGSPAVVKNNKGNAVLIGSFLALAYNREHYANVKRFFLSLAKAAGVSPEVEVSGTDSAEVEVRRLVGAEQQLILVVNHGVGVADVNLAVRFLRTVREARGLENNQIVSFRNNLGRTIFHKRLDAGEIWTFSIRGS